MAGVGSITSKTLSGIHRLTNSGYRSVLIHQCWSDEPGDTKVMNEQFHSQRTFL